MNVDLRKESAGPQRRVVIVAILAQAVEYFDFFVFATASAIFLGPLFFSELSGTVPLSPRLRRSPLASWPVPSVEQSRGTTATNTAVNLFS